jgi:hypothetical protein
MNWLVGAFMFVFSGLGLGISQTTAQAVPIFDIQCPTVIAFFPRVTDAELDSLSDTNEALADFQLYASTASKALRRANIDFRDSDSRVFKIRTRSKVRTFSTGKIGIGFYFIAPGKKAHVEYGVMTDSDILDTANKYFGVDIKK